MSILNKFEEISDINKHIFATQQIILNKKTLDSLCTELDWEIINRVNNYTQILHQFFNKPLFFYVDFSSLENLTQLLDSDLLLDLDEENRL